MRTTGIFTPAARTTEQRSAIRFLAGYRATLVAMAGSDFAWRTADDKVIGGYQSGPRADGKYGNPRNGYRVIVWQRQGGLCATCGDATPMGEFDVAHYVGNGGSAGKNGGYVDFNIMGCCRFCNILDDRAHGQVIPPSALAHPEFLMHSTPTRRECIAADATVAAEESRALAAHRERAMARIALMMEEGEEA